MFTTGVSTILSTGGLGDESSPIPVNVTRSALAITEVGFVRYDSYHLDRSKSSGKQSLVPLNPLFIITRLKESPARYQSLAKALVVKGGFNVSVISHDFCDRANPDSLLPSREWTLRKRAQALNQLIETEGMHFSHAPILVIDSQAKVITQYLRRTNPGLQVFRELFLNTVNPTLSEMRWGMALKIESLFHQVLAPCLLLNSLRMPSPRRCYSSEIDVYSEQVFGCSRNGTMCAVNAELLADRILAKVDG